MSIPDAQHPEPALLEALSALEPAERLAFDPRVLAHVEGCSQCRDVVAEFKANNRFLSRMMASARIAAEQSRRRKAARDGGIAAGSESGAAGLSRPLPDSALTGLPAIPGYELLGELHRGGQGVVFRARQTATKRDVAIKMPLAGSFVTERARMRFEREIELVAQLRHPNVVTVHDSGLTPDGRYYIVMELIDGVTLDRFLGSGKEPSTQTGRRRTELIVQLFGKIARAVQHAHGKGIIHRDLKPGNIMVDASGEPRVLDFGLARSGEWSPETSPTLVDEFQGTPAYASPEQVGGDPRAIDIRTDVYSLGIMLYRALTGQWPYAVDGSLADQIKNIKQTQPPAPSRRARFISSDLDTIILTALAKEPDRRYQSAGALAQDIAALLDGRPIAARPPSIAYVVRMAVQRHRIAVSLAAALALAVAAATGAWIHTQRVNARAAVEVASAQTAAAQLASSVLGRIGLAPGGEGARAFARGVLLAAAKDLDEGLSIDRPRTHIALRTQVAAMLASISEHKQAVNQLTAARALLTTLGDATAAELSQLQTLLAQAQHAAGNFADAADTARQALAQVKGTDRQAILQRAPLQAQLARALIGQGEHIEAIELCSTSVPSLSALFPQEASAERASVMLPLFDSWSRAVLLAQSSHELQSLKDAFAQYSALRRAAAQVPASPLMSDDAPAIFLEHIIALRIALTTADPREAMEAASQLLDVRSANVISSPGDVLNPADALDLRSAGLPARLLSSLRVPSYAMSADPADKRASITIRYADGLLRLLADAHPSHDSFAAAAQTLVVPLRQLGGNPTVLCEYVVARISLSPPASLEARVKWQSLLADAYAASNDPRAASAYAQALALLATSPTPQPVQEDKLLLRLQDECERTNDAPGAVNASNARLANASTALTAVRRLCEHGKLLGRLHRPSEAIASLEYCRWIIERGHREEPLLNELRADVSLTLSAMQAELGNAGAAMIEYIRSDADSTQLERANPVLARAFKVRRAAVLREFGDVQGAIALLEDAAAGLSENFGATGEWPRKAAEKLIMIYESTGQSRLADPYRTRLALDEPVNR